MVGAEKCDHDSGHVRGRGTVHYVLQGSLCGGSGGKATGSSDIFSV